MSTLQVDKIISSDGSQSPYFPNGLPNPFSAVKLVSTNTALIAGGYLPLSDFKEVVSYDGITYGADLQVNLKTEVNVSGITSPSASSSYYLYLDTTLIGVMTATPSGRTVYPAGKGASGALIVLATLPKNIDTTIYIPLAYLKTDSGSDYTVLENISAISHTTAVSSLISPDLTLTSSNTNFATQINAAGHNKWIHIAESIEMADANQTITRNGCKITSQPGAVITIDSDHMIIFSGKGNKIELNVKDTFGSKTATLQFSENNLIELDFEYNNAGTLSSIITVDSSKKVVGSIRKTVTSGTVTAYVGGAGDASIMEY
jgi:hypothetical protein